MERERAGGETEDKNTEVNLAEVDGLILRERLGTWCFLGGGETIMLKIIMEWSVTADHSEELVSRSPIISPEDKTRSSV